MAINVYVRLSDESREEISRRLAQGWSLRRIAVTLNRSPSTVSREVARNTGRSSYRAYTAARRAQNRAASRRVGQRKLFQRLQLRLFVVDRLQQCWSPDQIVRELETRYPNDTTMRVSPETIYSYIYVLPRGALKRSLIAGLRQERVWRRKHHRLGQRQETRGKLANMLSIEERPAEVADRSVPGHWEGDLVMGRYKRTALGTLVERTTRYTILVPLKQTDATSVRRAYVRAVRTLPKALTKTLTYDQGKEMSEHQKFSIATGITVYFAHPGSPWERGTNENTNGLIRQYFPKGTDFTTVSRDRIKRVQDLLNGRPRRALSYQKPQEVFTQLLR